MRRVLSIIKSSYKGIIRFTLFIWATIFCAILFWQLAGAIHFSLPKMVLYAALGVVILYGTAVISLPVYLGWGKFKEWYAGQPFFKARIWIITSGLACFWLVPFGYISIMRLLSGGSHPFGFAARLVTFSYIALLVFSIAIAAPFWLYGYIKSFLERNRQKNEDNERVQVAGKAS